MVLVRPTVAGPYAAGMPRKRLHARPCGVSCEGGRAGPAAKPQIRRSAPNTPGPSPSAGPIRG
ncbi:hypothetical protein FPL04_10315 [Xanthomonas arboricola]|nr:hypothetical protein FPL04_10315 [Xanthomonas arboricola]